ncbi:MAG: hypothetical protein K2Q25_09380, partial [Mycobacteriaceae bacterium]|nr:hypothetical protein [Mycobacteriaceae bacterium]
DDLVSTKNLSGQPGARIILNDPAVQAAVFEMPRKGLIVFGHPCDHYDVAALLNIQDDHIGVDGIDTVEQMADLKAEVLERARHAVVVNADDPLCMAMRSRAGTDRHILVTSQPTSPAVAEHRCQGGEAVFTDQRQGAPWIVLSAGDAEEPLIPVDAIPATMNGLLRFNVSNAMFAAVLAWAQGIDIGTIRRALGSFHNSVEQNPGRYNFIAGLPFTLLLDFAHNPDGVREVCAVAGEIPVTGRRILCSQNLGNRHAAHVAAVASAIAKSFDEFVVGCDPQYLLECPEYSGPDPVAAMLSATRQHLLDHGVDSEAITSIGDPAAVIPAALARARVGDLVVVLAEPHDMLPAAEKFRRETGPI